MLAALRSGAELRGNCRHPGDPRVMAGIVQLCLFLLCAAATSTMGRSLRVGSFNIRFDSNPQEPLDQASVGASQQHGAQAFFGAAGNPIEDHGQHPFPPHLPGKGKKPKKHEEPWHVRRSYLADQILFQDLALVGLQEVIHHQLEDLRILLGDQYDYVGVGRDDGRQRGEAVPIFYRTDELQLLEVEHFWLSETPHIPGSISWDSSMTRMATFAHFLDRKTGQTVYAVNTHYDHRGPVSRIEASKLILSKVQTVGQSKALVLLMGDFNSESTDGGYQTLTGGEYKSLYTPTYIVSHLASRAHFLDAEQELLTRSESSAKGFPPLLHRHFGETYSNPGFPRDKMKPKNIDFILFLDNGAVSPKKKGISSEPDKWHVIRHGIIPHTFQDWPLVSDHRLVVSEFYVTE